MTREEALGELGDRSLERAGVDGLIDDIYDSFEARICKNCEHHLVDSSETMIWCSLENGFLEDCRVHWTFGCTEWKPRNE